MSRQTRSRKIHLGEFGWTECGLVGDVDHPTAVGT